MPIEIADPPTIDERVPKQRITVRPSLIRALFCLVLAMIAVTIHGYHPFAVDGSIYVPAIKKLLNPALYPHDAEFFLFPSHLSIFAALIAASVRATSLPLEYLLLVWHVATIAVFLAACWRLCRLCFPRQWTALHGALLMAALLTIPVAGTSLMIWDPYLTSRSFSTPAILMAICCVIEKRLLRAGFWLLAAALVHPLMAVFGATFTVTLYAVQQRNWRLLIGIGAGATAVLLGGMAWARGVPITPEYRAAVLTRSYFFLPRWEWYEVFGLIAPLLLFGLMLWYRRHDSDRRISHCLTAAVLFGVFFLLAGTMIGENPSLLLIAKFQPLRAFHLLYVLLFLLPVNAFLVRVTASGLIPASALLTSVMALMFVVQQQTFPSSPHVELPWSHAGNEWVQAFDWVRGNTPKDAVFALDGRYTETPGEDCQGFNARAERSSLPDVSKDGGVVALFPGIAIDWARETEATAEIRGLSSGGGYRALSATGASWVLLQRQQTTHLDCPYENAAVAVCRLTASDPPTAVDGSKDERLPRVASLARTTAVR